MNHARSLAAAAASLCSLSAVAGGVPGTTAATALDTMTVVGTRTPLDAAQSATQGYVTAEQLAERPIARPGELLEFVPGMMVTQHSGEGKANQYFLRGFNLDHGTDFYTEVDGAPVNMRTHAHGQGYADINFIIPELIGSLDYRKGTYYADVGDFSAAGSASLRYVDALPRPILQGTIGENGYLRGLAAASPTVGDGNLLLGAEASRYDGPFAVDEDMRKYAGVARYNSGSAESGYTLTLMGYDIDYVAPDQIPLRAVEQGLIDRYGVIDPTDGGGVHRYSLSAEARGAFDDGGHWSAQAYALKYRMQLYSDFTYFYSDPTDADALPDDQFNQFDDRWVYGFDTRRVWSWRGGVPVDVVAGLQGRYDDIDTVALRLSQQRQLISDGTVRSDSVGEGSLAGFVDSAWQWTPWFQSRIGLRADYYDFDVDSEIDDGLSGRANDHIVSPKLALVFGPFADTRLFANYGEGFHSNDARGVTLPGTRAVDPLVKARGGEIGVTSQALPNVGLALSLWALNMDSELVYIGDEGGSEASSASKRRGIELAAYWSPLQNLMIDADYAYAHSRLDADDGGRIPNAISDTFGVGVTLSDWRGFSAGLRLRHLGPAPLVEDNSARSASTTVVNAQLGYRWNRWRARLDVLNLLDSRDNDITYFYASRLPGEAAEGVEDIHFHPVEPRQLRLTLSVEL